MSMLCLHVLDIYACVVFSFFFLVTCTKCAHSSLCCVCQSNGCFVKYHLLLYFQKVLYKIGVVCPATSSPRPIMWYNVKPSSGLSGCWLSMVQCTQTRTPVFSWKRPLLKGDRRGNNYRKRNEKRQQELSHVLQWYQFLLCRSYRPCSASLFISVGK